MDLSEWFWLVWLAYSLLVALMFVLSDRYKKNAAPVTKVTEDDVLALMRRVRR